MIKFNELKKFFIWTFIGSLIAAALAAVITVLIGQFSEVTTKVFLTLFTVIGHSLISLLFIWDDSRRNTFTKLAFFVNTIFVLIILSFITSIFGVWKFISSETSGHLYQTYLLIGFASLHIDILSKALKREKYMDYVIYANYAFILGVVLMMLPIIFLDDAIKILGEVYFRGLAAAGIVDGTLSILTIVFYKLYMNRHPELHNDNTQMGQPRKKGLSIWMWILVIYLLVQITFPLFFLFLGGIGRFLR